MREGLRSGKLRQRVKKDEGSLGNAVAQKKLFDMDCKVDESVDIKDVLPESTLEDTEAEKLGFSVTYIGEVEDVDKCRLYEGLKFKQKMKKEDAGEECQYPLGTGKNQLREEGSDEKVQISGRVLPSRMRPVEVDQEKREDVAADCEVKRGQSHKLKNERIKIEEDDKSCDLIERIVEKTLKRKRGRPPKTCNATLQGRPPKACDTMPKRRGRPPLAQGPVGVLGNYLQKKQKVDGLRKNKRTIETKDTFKQTRSTRKSKRESRLNKDSKSKSPLCMEVEYENPKEGVIEAKERVQGGKDGLTRALEKQLVRNRITKLLFDAGWTVDYRPRQGKAYDDAVYVSPDGKTHWSVTLAYRVLKQRYEDGDAEAYKEGFSFSPIPQEELNILKRVQIKKRQGKKKHEVPVWRGKPESVVDLKKKMKKGKRVCHSGMTARKMSFDGRMKRKILQHKKGISINAPNAQSAGNRKCPETRNRKTCGLLVRRSDGVETDADGYVLYGGRRTTLAWMIDSGILLDKLKVSYMNQTRSGVMLQGRITRAGIDCGCCGETVTISEFESHSGSKLGLPLENIFLENGSSLLQCHLDAWYKLTLQNKWFCFVDVCGDDPNDDTCGICGDGGNLVCCDSCPSTFHQNCLDIQKFPSGAWYCLYCTCKYCGHIGKDLNQENIEELKSSLLSCCLCDQKYHNSCIHADDAMECVQDGLHFCGTKCQEIYGKIDLLLGVKHELEDGFSWTLVQRCEVGDNISSTEVTRKIGCNSKLAVALSVMDECFLPSSDPRSGINVIHNVLYSCGSNFKRLNFNGFYTLTLEMGDEIISVATIRIHGNLLAEMPYIGTRFMYRRQGMCRRLVIAVEYVLHSLGVENLVIPAISELKNTWTSAFGFVPLQVSILKKMRSMNVLVFPGIDMLQKSMSNSQCTGDSKVHTEGLISSGQDHPGANEATEVFDSIMICCEKLDNDIASQVVTAVNPTEETEKKSFALKSSSQLLNGSSNDLSDITSECIDCPNCSNNIRIHLGNEPCNILKAEKSHPQSEGTSCGLICLFDPVDIDGDLACDVKAANSDSQHLPNPPCKGPGENSVDDGSPNEPHDSFPSAGTNYLELLNQRSNEPDEVSDLNGD
ncbi:hypothetical protein SAY87_016344 [Trapa incisa]|uniref:PHD-type domain-containing protein n=1 Tax=Trapa incisa TaxID=236973 RepID=A0AAN7L137_9MYRT|nr:hypothetical protein SAY87_016344 [Trapa incisa]